MEKYYKPNGVMTFNLIFVLLFLLQNEQQNAVGWIVGALVYQVLKFLFVLWRVS